MTPSSPFQAPRVPHHLTHTVLSFPSPASIWVCCVCLALQFVTNVSHDCMFSVVFVTLSPWPRGRAGARHRAKEAWLPEVQYLRGG